MQMNPSPLGAVVRARVMQLQSWTDQMKNEDHPSPHFNDGKMACFALRANSSLILGEDGGGGGG